MTSMIFSKPELRLTYFNCIFVFPTLSNGEYYLGTKYLDTISIKVTQFFVNSNGIYMFLVDILYIQRHIAAIVFSEESLRCSEPFLSRYTWYFTITPYISQKNLPYFYNKFNVTTSILHCFCILCTNSFIFWFNQ